MVEGRTDIISSYRWGNGGRERGKQSIKDQMLLRIGDMNAGSLTQCGKLIIEEIINFIIKDKSQEKLVGGLL